VCDTATIKYKPIDLSQYKKRSAKETDYSRLITRSTILVDEESGKPRIVYLMLEDDCIDIVQAILSIQFEGLEERTSGLLSQSRIVGYRPRITTRDDFCTSAKLARENPYAHKIVMDYAIRVSSYYKQYNPGLFSYHQQELEKVLPEWKIKGTVFTSGIINKNNPLPYHFDSGNFRSVWSNMLAFKYKIAGGYLSVPEYDVGFEIAHNSLLMFDGQHLLHGVTPIYQLDEHSFRFSIVYYSLQQMWNCLPPDEEVRRIQKIRTAREEERLQRQESGEKYNPHVKKHRIV
jgi:hypothetical protein